MKWLSRNKKRSAHEATLDLSKMSRYFVKGDENVFFRKYNKALSVTKSTDNVPKQNRFFTLFQMTQHILKRNIVGDVAECGCWRGHSTYLIAECLQEAGWNNEFWVFDSFEGGLSDKTTQDRQQRGDTDSASTNKEKRHFSSSFDDVSDNLKAFPFMQIRSGWIPEVLDQPGLSERKFSLVHVDVDLYEPTKASMEFFFPRMSTGGVIVIDDYGSSNFPGAQTAVDEYLSHHECSFFLESHLMGAVIVK